MTDITVYSTPTCPWCRMLKDYLRQNKVDFRDIDVSSDHEAAREMVSKSGQTGVPQTEINGRIIVGFDKEELEKELSKQKKQEEQQD